MQTTNLLPSVMPLGYDRFGNAYYVFPNDYNYVYVRMTEKSEEEMKAKINQEAPTKSLFMQSMNQIAREVSDENGRILRQFEKGLISQSTLNGKIKSKSLSNYQIINRCCQTIDRKANTPSWKVACA